MTSNVAIFEVITAVLLRFVSVGVLKCGQSLTMKKAAGLSFETSDSTIPTKPL